MNHYTPKPIWQLLPFFMLLVTALVAGWYPSWITALTFIGVLGMSMVTSLWIAWAGKTREETEYWFWIGSTVRELQKSDPAIWEALGLSSPPEYAHLEIVEFPNEEQVERREYYSVKYTDAPINPTVLTVFADGILTGRRTLSENQWQGRVSKYRKFQDWMEEHKLIAMVNPDAATQGYILTELGEKWLLQYASSGVGGSEYVRQIPIRSDSEVAQHPRPT